jgi:uncharacterized coiled-coil DUF342 family protein
VEKPNKDEHEAELAALQITIDALKTERQAVQDKIKEAMNPGGAKNSALNELRTKMAVLKQRKNALIEEKKLLRANLDQSKASADKIMKDKKDVKSNLKYSSMAEIDAEIKKLQVQQETTTMTLNQEKKLLKEIDGLQASKKFIVVVQAKDTAMEDVQLQRKSIQVQIQEKDKEIDIVSKELDGVVKVVKEHNEKDSSAREAIQDLYNEKDTFKGKIDEIVKQKDALRDVFREQQNAFYQNQRAVRAQKQMIYEEEKKRRDEEYAARQAEIEAEEAKKIPYEEEQALCEFLADYLERTYLGVDSKGINTDTVVTAKKDEPVAVSENPFEGLQAIQQKEMAETAVFFGKGKQKKKRVRTPKDITTAPFTLSVDSFEQFGMVMLDPPISIDQVPDSVKALREKKEWYKAQPRGSVPTAADIRKAAAKVTKSSAAAASTDGKSKKSSANGGGSNFSLKNDDFVPLSAAVAGSAAAASSSWGKTSAAPETTE